MERNQAIAGNRIRRGWLIIFILLISHSWALADGIESLPRINEPTPPGGPAPIPGIQWDHRFHVTGRILGFGNDSIRVNRRQFQRSADIRYFDMVGNSSFFSSFKLGTPVGLILDGDLNILQLWKLPDT